ncbi:hypothetical protein [Streptomyces sp. NPDC002671]
MIPTMRDGRQADTERHRQRVATAVRNAAKNGTPISVSVTQDPAGRSPVSRASLQTDLANAQARNTPLAARIQHLEKRLSQTLGAQAWQESGLGAPADIDELQRKITRLAQQNVGRSTTGWLLLRGVWCAAPGRN